MANATTLKNKATVRMLLTGFPGSGKTGALACLAGAGFKLRILDFDGNPESLINFCPPEALANIDILSLEDQYVDAGKYVGIQGVPTAFTRALQALIRWKYKDADGTDVDDKGVRWTDLGKSAEWGPDHILVVDGLTGLSSACMARAQAMTNKTPVSMEQSTWGLAGQDQMNFIKRITAATNTHHTIVISHLKMKGPKPIGNEKDDVNKTIKQQIAELIPTRWYPTGVGQEVATNIAGEFPTVVNIEVAQRMGKMVRRFNYLPREDMDLKLPAKLDDNKLDVETGLLTIFKALGAVPPLEATLKVVA